MRRERRIVSAAHRIPSPAWAVPWVVAEVFAGVGSVARGFARAGGFQVAYLNDIDPVARATYLANDSPETIYELRDVRKVTGRTIRDAADGRPVAGLLGCPPCQGWSAAGQRDAADRRNRLLKDFFRLVNSVYPVFFVMENVPSVADRAELAAALSTLRGRYRVWRGVLNAAAYGLPQSRQRVLVIGYRHDTGVTPSAPPPTHAGRRKIWDYRTETFVEPSPGTLDALLGAAPRLGAPRAAQYTMRDYYPDKVGSLARFVTVGEAIGDLVEDAHGPRSGYARVLGAGKHVVANHEPWDHGKDLVERLRLVREGCRPPIEATTAAAITRRPTPGCTAKGSRGRSPPTSTTLAAAGSSTTSCTARSPFVKPRGFRASATTSSSSAIPAARNAWSAMPSRPCGPSPSLPTLPPNCTTSSPADSAPIVGRGAPTRGAAAGVA